MSSAATRLPSDAQPPSEAARGDGRRRRPMSRRGWSLPRPLVWAVTAVLSAFLIGVGTGVIHTEIADTGTPAAVVPHRVDPTQGFGKPADYTGRYEVRGLRASGGSVPSLGSMLLFLRSEGPDQLLLPSGTLSLSGSGGNFVGYVTDLHIKGNAVRAVVRGGTFQGPAIGSLHGVVERPGRFTATVRAPGIGSLQGQFVRVARTSGYAEAQPLP